MTNIKNIHNEFVTIKGVYGVVNQGHGYAIVNIQTGECMAHNISSFYDCVRTIEILPGGAAPTKSKAQEKAPESTEVLSNLLCEVDIYDSKIRKKIENVSRLGDSHSNFYGKLVNWHSKGFWHYGIGLSDEHIFDLGENLDVFHKEDREIKFVMKVKHFSSEKTIRRLAHALCCFKDWHYGLLGWNCEHYSRLVVTNVAISYQVKKSPLAFLNHGGYHPTAVQDLTNYLHSLRLFELTQFDN